MQQEQVLTLEMKYMGGRERYVEMREKEEKGPGRGKGGGGQGDEIKNPEVSTKTVSSPESPQKGEEEEQMEAVIGVLPISSINRFTHN